jgi:uncharacterized protein (DUF1015 family)
MGAGVNSPGHLTPALVFDNIFPLQTSGIGQSIMRFNKNGKGLSGVIMEIKPFKAFRFDEAVVGDVGSCIAPPYDVIDSDLQERLYKKSKYNIIRITKGKTALTDSPGDNQYTRAARLLADWLQSGALKRDTADAIYGYVQDFKLAGRKVRRISFIAQAKLEEFGKGVRPHEHTLEEPKIDRLNLRRATKATFGLVFMLYRDAKNIADKAIEKAAKQEPLIDFVDEQDVRHRLFAITEKTDIDAIAKMMGEKTCIIADGHHRYETALAYYKETGEPAAQYVLTAFVNTRQDGLFILATHRLTGNVADFNPQRMITDLRKDFEVSEYGFDSSRKKASAKQKMLSKMKAEFDADRNAFGIYTGNNVFYVAVLKNKNLMDTAAPNMSSYWKSLDVVVLHKLILEKLLGIGEQRCADGGNIGYVKDTGEGIDESIAQVDSGQKQAAFFVNPTKLKQIELVTSAGERMPQKSTFFYPKVYTGLVITKL